MTFKDNVFVSNTIYSGYGNNTLSIDPNTALKKTVELDKYNNIKEEQNNIYYKIINLNFEFKKVFKIKLNFVSLHIGDIIDYITKKTGIKKLIIKLTNGNCGCEARRIKFNKWFKVPIIFFKFDKLNYKDEINLAKIKQDAQDVIDQNNVKLSEEQIIENIKLNMINKKFERYNEFNVTPAMDTDPQRTNKKSGGCGCGARKQLSKRTNYA